jgi:hypothetical protein
VIEPRLVRREAIALLELLERKIIKSPHPLIRATARQSEQQHPRAQQEDDDRNTGQAASNVHGNTSQEGTIGFPKSKIVSPKFHQFKPVGERKEPWE